MFKKTFEPKLITVLREGYHFKDLCRDAVAGLVVGIVAMPLAVAFAIASGVKPEQGLITTIIAGLLVALLSGSRVQISGPTGAFIIIVLGIVQKFGYEGLALATCMAGILLVIMGFMKLGDIIKYVPYPVTVGFTSGIALVIFTAQIPDLLGLQLARVPGEFLPKWLSYAQSASTINFNSAGLGFLTIAIINMWPKITRRVPGTLVAIIVTTAATHLLGLPVDTVGSRFGTVSAHIPMPHLPLVSFSLLKELFSPAFTIALLAGIESLLSAVVADGMLGTRHRANMELVAQGVANIFSPLFGGIPATGAIARTATNIKNGGRTPVAGIIHAATVLVMFLFCAKAVGLIPMACLAGILVDVSYRMSEWRHFKRLLRSPRSDVLVLVLTFGLTVLVDLTVAIEVGVVLAALLFMHRMAHITTIKLVDDDNYVDRPHEYDGVPEGIEIFEINGPFFFGAADKFHDTIASIKQMPRVLILRMSDVPAIDATALINLERLVESAQRGGTHVIFAGINKRVFKVIRSSGFLDRIGIEHIFADVPLALAQAITYIAEKDSKAIPDSV